VPLTYASYLSLDDLLGAQHPRTEEHDELLFIVIHQVYELWFKQLLHEVAELQRRLEAGDGPAAAGTIRRVLAILKTVVAQIDVLETMTPRQFGAFRGQLDAASGFQSAQFRELEVVLGRRDGRGFAAHPEGSEPRRRLEAALRRRSLIDSFARYLVASGYAVPAEVLERDPAATVEPSPALQDVLCRVYADEGEAAQVCERLLDIDEGLLEWRYRHVVMVQRVIGARPGTGGSAGAAYLRETLLRPIFVDLWAVRDRI
jgi:tryptophan 2,3-dioxygenase